MVLNVGPIEHVHRIRLPLASSDDLAIQSAADEAARKTFTQEGPKFAYFPRLPPEVQTMIWEATLEPRTFRAWGYTESPKALGYQGHYLWNSMDRRWLLVECSPFRQAHIPLYGVCRLSRALALSTYGTPYPTGEGTHVFLHPDLDTIEVLGHSCHVFEGKDTMWPFVSRDASKDRGIEDVTVKMVNPACDELPIYWGRQALSPSHDAPADSRADWLILGVPLDRAKRVVLCHDPRAPFRLNEIADWAGAMLPNVEELTLRSHIDPLEDYPHAHAPAQERMGQYVGRMMLAHKRGRWPRLRTIDFTRQSVPGCGPVLQDAEAWDDEFGTNW